MLLPFKNALCHVTLKGSELKKCLLHGLKIGIADNVTQQNGSFIIGGEKLIESSKYTLVISDFLANGGDRFPILTDKKSFLKMNCTDTDALTEYLEKIKEIK